MFFYVSIVSYFDNEQIETLMSKRDIKSLIEAVEKAPDNIALRLTLALKQFKLKQYEDSEKNYLAVLKIDPENVKAKQGLIDLYFIKENYSAVIVLGEELVNKNNVGEKTLEALAKSYLRQDNIKDAQEIYEKIVKRNPFYFDEELDSVLDDGDTYEENFEEFDDDGDEYEDAEDYMSDFPFGNMPEGTFQLIGEHLLVNDFGYDFSDIIGLDEVKDLVKLKLTFSSMEPILANSFGFRSNANILLYGPHGCGKTLFTKSLPGEFDCKLLPIGADMISGFIGNTQYFIHQIFRLARSKNPRILFFDDADFIAFKRENSFVNGQPPICSMLIGELDGIYSSNEDLLIILATGAPWLLDPAIIRSGRTDYCFFIAPPNREQRFQYFSRTLNVTADSDQSVLKALVDKTNLFSYADLNQIFTWVTDRKMMQVMRKEVSEPKLTVSDFIEVIEEFTPGTAAWITEFLDKVEPELRNTGFYKDVLVYARNNKLV